MYGYNPNAQAMPYMPYQTSVTPSSNVSWVYVNGLEGARSQIVQPGQTAWMMDNSDAVIYVKAVDTMGTATLKAFKLTEISASPAEKVGEMDVIRKRLDEIEKVIGGLNA